jgi:hypothetical protein
LLTYHYPAYFPDPAPFENAFNLNASQQEAADGAGTNGSACNYYTNLLILFKKTNITDTTVTPL